MRREIRIMPSVSINVRRISVNTKLSLRRSVSRMRRSAKSRDSVSFRRRPLIVKLRLMLYVPSAPLRRVKDRLDSAKSLSMRRDSASLLTSRLPARDSSRRSR